MKKIKVFLCLLLSCIMLCSCSSQQNDYSIENHEWEFYIVQSMGSGETIYCSEQQHQFNEDAEVIDIWNTMEDNKIIISNNETQESWTLDYTLKEKDETNTIYEITYKSDGDTINGLATVSTTTREDGNDEYTLIISINNYAIYFTEEM